jgi:hypothetical protein
MNAETDTAKPRLDKPSLEWHRKSDVRVYFAPDSKDDGVYEQYFADLGAGSEELLGLRFQNGSGAIYCPDVSHPDAATFHGLTLDEAKTMAEQRWEEVQANHAQPPLTLADLSEEQATEISRLAHNEDHAPSYVGVSKATNALIVEHRNEDGCFYRTVILNDFDVFAHRYGKKDWLALPVHNQRAIQRLFTELGAE